MTDTFSQPTSAARAVRLRARRTRSTSTPTATCSLRAQHVDDLQDRPRHRPDHLAPGRQAQRLQARRGPRASPGSTTCSGARRTAPHAVRQLGDSRRAQVLARDGFAARREQRTASLDLGCVAPAKLLTATQGNQQTLPNGNIFVGWGSQRQLTEFDAGRQRRLHARCRSATSPTAPTGSVGRAAAHAAEGRRGRRAGRGHRRLHELERRDRRRHLGAVRRLERRAR